MDNDAKLLNKILADWIQQCIKKNPPQPSRIYPCYIRLVQYLKFINAIHHIYKLKKKNHMIINGEKAFDKTIPIHDKNFQ